MQSTVSKIIGRVRGKGRGSVWSPADFLDLGSRDSVDQSLSRLVRRGHLRRIARGVYAYPVLSARLGALTPPPDDIAAALAKAKGGRVQVSGARAANDLGLSTQVPAQAVYLTDGPSRTVKVGRQVIRLKHVTSTQMAGAGTKAGMVIQALRYLGRGLDPAVLRRLAPQLSAHDRRTLRKTASAAPGWVQPALWQLAQG
ncbi:MAG TPA: DUF6088 family protein [Longimicrobium sp.]|jgi:hypothetical protein|nr:DUF6088 family protein [Longimicrobium sp.]